MAIFATDCGRVCGRHLVQFDPGAHANSGADLVFWVKLIAVGLTLYLTARWVGGEIFNFTQMLFDGFPLMIR